MAKTTKKDVEETIKEVKDDIKKQVDLNKVEEILNKNTYEFDFNEATYRVRKPVFKEKNDAYAIRIEKFNELLDNPKYKLEEDLKVSLLKRNIDVDKMLKDIGDLEKEKIETQMKLGKLLKDKKDKASDGDIEILEKEIEKITEKQLTLSVKKTNLLQTSIEQQSLLYTYQYLTYLVLEKQEGKDWKRVFESFDDFLNGEETLINQASFNASLIIGDM